MKTTGIGESDRDGADGIDYEENAIENADEAGVDELTNRTEKLKISRREQVCGVHNMEHIFFSIQ